MCGGARGEIKLVLKIEKATIHETTHFEKVS
uniref:Uncharacterized protein n=1 Tax=Anopheles minimus TaxID=112268 RepID=A0A182WN09_9DIPT